MSIVVIFGGLGPALQPFSPLVAIVLALVLPPILAIATRGRYYLRRTDDGIDPPIFDEYGNPSGEVMRCHVCREGIERPDVARCATHDAVVCALPEPGQGRGPRAPRPGLSRDGLGVAAGAVRR